MSQFNVELLFKREILNYYLDVHTIQSFPPSCLVRDDVGNPKTISIGGVKRARIPSSSKKRVMREGFEKKWEMFSKLFGVDAKGIRTKNVREMIADKMVAIDSSIKRETAMNIIADFTEKTITTDALFFISNRQAENIARLFVDYYRKNREKIDGIRQAYDEDVEKENTRFEKEKAAAKEKASSGGGTLDNKSLKEEMDDLNKKHNERLSKLKKDMNKKYKDGLGKEMKACFAVFAEELRKNPAIDMLFFGRMNAQDPRYGYEATVMVAEFFSVHKIAEEYDYFTACEEYPKDGEHGAAHIGTRTFNASTYYGYSSLNLKETLGSFFEYYGKEEEALAAYAVCMYVEQVIESVPHGMINRCAQTTLPVMTYVTIGTRATSMSDAFEEPVLPGKNGGYEKNAVKRFAEVNKEKKKAYGGGIIREWYVSTADYDDGIFDDIHTDMKTMLKELGEEVLREQEDLRKRSMHHEDSPACEAAG